MRTNRWSGGKRRNCERLGRVWSARGSRPVIGGLPFAVFRRTVTNQPYPGALSMPLAVGAGSWLLTCQHVVRNHRRGGCLFVPRARRSRAERVS